jgi:putative inorganic carbon (hco3(-)) transporter
MVGNRTGEITTTFSKPTTVSRISSAIVLSQETFWALQAWGFLLLIGMSFSPRLFHLEEYLFFLLLVSTIVVALKTRHSLWIHTSLDVPLLLFVGWVLLTVPFAIDPLYSFGEWRKLVVQILVFYWTLLVLQQTQRRGMTSKVIGVVVFATAAICLYALQDFVARGGTWQNRSIRASAPNSDYNWLTTYMVIAIPIICAGAVRNLDLWRRIGVAAIGIFAIIAQLISYTRAGWLGMIVQGISFGIWTARRQVIVWVIVGIVSVGAVFAGLRHLGYQRDTVDPWTLVEARSGAWKLQAQEVMQHPIVGIGYGSGTFMKRFSGYPEAQKADGPHSTFLMIAMGSGIPAVGVFIWMMFRAVKILVRGAKEAVGREARAFLLAVAVMIVGFATRNCFDYMFAGSLAFLFWLLVATALSSLHPTDGVRA